MSAIYGVLRQDGQAVETDVLKTLGVHLRRRGEKAPLAWLKGAIGLGHCMLPTTPEAEREILPRWNHPARVAITADARIDNREDLLGLLDLRQTANDSAMPDSDVILHAYGKWGVACAERLVGDFAFAIWDERERRLFCARDHFGIKPFFFAHESWGLAFASEIPALLALPSVSREINQETVANFLVGMLEDGEETLYAKVHRLPPGHSLTSHGLNGVQLRRYYEPELRPAPLKDSREYPEKFRELFTRAVKRRLRSKGPVACMLSGGLDSSSVACVAERARKEQAGLAKIHTISNLYPDDPECDESAYIRAVLAEGDYEAHFENVDSRRSFSYLEALCVAMGEPTAGSGFFANNLVYPSVRKMGLNVVLDGHGGDEVMSEPGAVLRELAEQNRWLSFARCLPPVARTHGLPVFASIKAFAYSYGATGRLRKKLRQGFVRKRAHADPPRRHLWAAHLDKRWLEQTTILDRRSAWLARQPDQTTDAQLAHQRRVFNTGQGWAFESLDRASAISAVEARYPFWDKDVVEFCLAAPPKQKLSGGWNRRLLQCGLKGILPEAVRRRPRKTNFSTRTLRAFRSLGEKNLRKLLYEAADFGTPMADSNWFKDAITHLFRTSHFDDDLMRLWLCVSVLMWRRRQSVELGTILDERENCRSLQEQKGR